MIITICIIALLAVAVVIFMHRPAFGRLPRGKRLQRIELSPNYREGRFRNQSYTPQLTSDKSFPRQMWDFLFRKKEGIRPDHDVPTVKTDLTDFDKQSEVYVWLGHGSYYFQTGGNSFLVDPVFYSASPVSFINRPFPGTDIYTPGDMPDIDYLVITHDHWDHLDFRTVKELRPRVGRVICPLGVGEYFERWGYAPEKLIEMDWYDEASLGRGTTLYCTPARHFSGRSIKPNRSLWASYLIKSPARTIFIGGDGGYDGHFGEIAEKYGPIDLAILENGQYDMDWRYIHMLPGDLVKAIHDLRPERVATVHNSKYALAKHPWREPLDKIWDAAAKDSSINLLIPMIGQPVDLDDPSTTYVRWWDTAGKP